MRNRELERFGRWLPQARSCATPDLQRFVAGLEADPPAVRAAFSSPQSSGQVEGQINRLKYLKRQIQGHAELDLLCIPCPAAVQIFRSHCIGCRIDSNLNPLD